MPNVTIRHLAPHCGSEICDVDPRTMTDAQISQAKSEVANRCVIVIRNANLNPEELSAFALRFGPILRVGNSPNYKAEGVMRVYNNYDMAKDNPEMKNGRKILTTNQWHTDASHERAPPSFTMLSAELMPELFGDTMWINQYLAYETLSNAMQKMLSRLRAGHAINAYFRKVRNEDTPLETFHPIVRVNPDTGRRSLFINNPIFMSTIEGMTEDESTPMLSFLHRHSQQLEHSYRHHWQGGDLVCWDNRCALHYALLDYPPTVTRNLCRITVKGEEPIPAGNL